MKDKIKSTDAILRRKAEELLKKKNKKTDLQLSESEPMRLIHELEVHQIELELQNEELLLARSAALESIEKYTELYDFAPTGYYTLSKEGEIIELNLLGAKMLGKERSLLKNSSFMFFISNESKSIFHHFLIKVFNSQTLENCEIKVSTFDNLKRCFYLTGIVTNNEGQCHVTAVDLTERKKLDELLQKNEERFRAITKSANDAIITINSKGIVLDWNRGAESIFGYTEEEITGKELTLIIPHHYIEQHKNGIKRIEQGESKVRSKTFELKGLHKSGNEFPIELSLSDWVIASGRYFTGIIRDITERKLAEALLEESQAKYQAIFESTGTATIIVDEDTTILMANNENYSITGYTPAELTGQKWTQFVAPESLELMLKNHYLRRKDPTLAQKKYEVRLINKKGEIHDAILDIGMIPGTGQGIVSFIDISDRKRAEVRQQLFAVILEYLNRHGEWHNLISDILKEIKSFTGFDAVGIRLREGSDYPYFVQNGFSEDFIRTEKYLCDYGKSGNIILDPSGNPYLACMCGNIISGRTDPSKSFFTEKGSFWSNRTTDLLAKTSEKDLQACTRNRCNGEGYESVALIPIRSGDKIIGLLQLNDKHQDKFTLELIKFFEEIGTSIGVAFSRMKSENKIRESEEQYRNLVENALVGVYRISFDGAIIFGNRALKNILQIYDEDFSKFNISNFYKNPTDRDELLRLLGEEREIKNFETKLITFKGENITVIINSKLEGNVLSGMIMDITSRKRMEEELLRATNKAETSDRLKSSFLANMSHEIRTPLNAIVGFSGLFTNPDLSQEKKIQYSKIIRSRSDDLLYIINDILEISRIESGNATVTKEQIVLNDILEELDMDFRQKLRQINKAHLHLVCEKPLSASQSGMITDRHIVKQVFINLIENAIKFTESGTIRFGYHLPDNNLLTCYVLDSGIGISADNQELIFENFRQAEISDRKKLYGGTGLGLSICKGSLALLGGKIWVESKPGEGAAFYFTVPFEQDAEKKTGRKHIQERKHGENAYNWTGKKLLLVEDEETNLEFLNIILEPTMAELVCAVNGQEVRNLYGNLNTFDLVLLDIRLPDANGWDLAREIKKIRPHLPVIVQTAYAMTSDRKISKEMNCDDYISKPINIELLLQMISNHI